MQTGGAQRSGIWLTSSATSAPPEIPAPAPAQQPPQLMTLGWAVKRALLGLVILLTLAGLSAWLLYASIEPDGTAGTRSEYAAPSG